jgi:hypothetical protein
MQTQNYTVQRPVTETTFQTQQFTQLQPVTTYQTVVADVGNYVQQAFYQPGDTTHRLRWQQGGYNVNQQTGQIAFRFGGLGWVPYQSAGQVVTQSVYQPNFQQFAVPQISYMPQTFTQQVPVQTQRMVTEQVQQQVPVTTTRIQQEVVAQQIPISTTRMQQEIVQQQVPVTTTRMTNEIVEQQTPVQVQRMETYEEKVLVPYTVQKPVTRKVARQKIEYVPEVVVKEVPVTTTTYRDEIVTEDVVVRVPYTERVVTKVQVPKRVAKTIPVTETRMAYRTRIVKVPIDAYGNPIVESRPATSNGSASTYAEPGSLKEPAKSNGAGNNGTESRKVEASKPEVDKSEELPERKSSQKLEISPLPGNGETEPNETLPRKKIAPLSDE